jgi:hypothetical protein
MRYRLVPPPGDRSAITAVADAVPRDSSAVDHCCAHVVTETFVDTRDAASEWLVFLAALGLLAEDDAGYYRTEQPCRQDFLAESFVSNVYGVREVLDALADTPEPLTTVEVCERVRASYPEQNRGELDGASSWEQYTDRILGWAVVFELVARSRMGYERR